MKFTYTLIRQLLLPRAKASGIGISLVLLLLLSSGCASRKPLPYEHSAAVQAAAGAPLLSVKPMVDERPDRRKDRTDSVLAIPACVDVVIAAELERSGLFSKVVLVTNELSPKGFMLEGKLRDFRWEVPNYEQKVGTATVLSVVSGGIGGMIYGSTGTDVLGHATIRFVLRDLKENRVLLDQEYKETVTEETTKLACDTPKTCRAMASKALKSVLDRFKEDAARLDLQTK